MNYLFLLVALVCAIAGEVVALGYLSLGTPTEWLFATLIAYLLSLLVPWAEARRPA